MASDSDSDEDFVSYGTPLEPLGEDETVRKPVPLQEQTVRDEKGRYQRFHGAFTGGFSAGYFNTVGSKEGWAPSSFVSSRQQKVQLQNFQPEDFMDEEDLNEHGIAPRDITTTKAFGPKRSDPITEKARAINTLSGPILGETLLDELISPSRSSIGVQLLRNMGWRDGQGVGPRVRKRKLRKEKAESGSKMYGCSLPEDSEPSEDEDDEFAPMNVTFAPKDVAPMNFDGKDNVHGLGYRGLDPNQALLGPTKTANLTHIDLFSPHSDRTSSLFRQTALSTQTYGRRGVTGQAFGGDDEDDGGVYHKDSMANYDSVLGGEEPGDGLYGWTAPRLYKTHHKDSKKDATYLGKILEGFRLASKKEEPKMIAPPPCLPRDYRPVHFFSPSPNMDGVTPAVAAVLRNSKGHLTLPSQEIGRHQLDSTKRGELLGETSLRGPSSVFELLRPEDKERLSHLREKTLEQQKDRHLAPVIPDLSCEADRKAVVASAKATALSALSSRFQSSQTKAGACPQSSQQGGQENLALAAWSAPTADTKNTFKPFDKNPSKQARYEKYLTLLKQGCKDALERSLDMCMTEWERGREREEFVRAALLYKPSSSVLSSRFTRSRETEDDNSVEVPRDQENDLDDKQAAVKMNMFGKLTRETFEWHPDKVLCKRFNVPDPYSGSGLVGVPKVKRDRFSVFNFLTVENPTVSSHLPEQTQALSSQSSDAGRSGSRFDVVKATLPPAIQTDPLSQLITEARSVVCSLTPGNDKTTGEQTNEVKSDKSQSVEEMKDGEGNEEEAEEEKRPPMDLFKAIFSSSDNHSSSSSDELEEQEEPEKELPDRHEPVVGPGVNTDLPLTSHAHTSSTVMPPSLLTDTSCDTNTLASKMQGTPIQQQENTEGEFGPSLPPPNTQVVEKESVRKRGKERKKDKKKHKHKKDKKQKKKQKKAKHRTKEKKRKQERETDSSSDTDSSELEKELSTDTILQRLKNIRGQL